MHIQECIPLPPCPCCLSSTGKKNSKEILFHFRGLSPFKQAAQFQGKRKRKDTKKSNCPCVKENLSFRSLITANVIKSSYSIENEQKKSMENCLTDAEGSGWEVGDDKPCQQYVWEPVSFIVMQLQTSTQMLYGSSLTVNCEGIWSIFFIIYSDFVKPCPSKLSSLFQHAKDSHP